MKKIKLFIFLSVSFLLVGCTNKKNHINIHKVSIYVDLDYKAEKKEYIRLWINDKMIFSNYSNSWRTYIASISVQKKDIKDKAQLLDVDTTYFPIKKQNVDTTFYYKVKDIDRLGIGYLKAYNGFVIFDSKNKKWWILE